ncbi:hypothetical protein BC940DRAFT_335864 [Gongronella butleri]|nr:hypothetical protein BC940DRAFT_335864 [Gongronella butleri]
MLVQSALQDTPWHRQKPDSQMVSSSMLINMEAALQVEPCVELRRPKSVMGHSSIASHPPRARQPGMGNLASTPKVQKDRISDPFDFKHMHHLGKFIARYNVQRKPPAYEKLLSMSLAEAIDA